MNTFGHSGDLGDIIYSLPTIRAAGGGDLVLYDHPGRTAHGMSKAKVDRIRPLLELQDYINEVRWSELPYEHDLNGFRDHNACGYLADMHLATHGLSWTERAKAWLHVEPEPLYEVVIARSERYLNPRFPWDLVLTKYSGRIGFVGFGNEHYKFCTQFGDVPLIDAPNLLAVAQVIKGSKLFIGNSSCPLAIAEGLKHNIIQEVCPVHHIHHLTEVQRIGHVMCWDHRLELPNVL